MLTASQPTTASRSVLDQLIEQVEQVVLGKRTAITLAVSCVLAGGHLLVEDLPGMGKTTLAQALAKTLGLEFQRIQFTSDMLPADVLGAAVYDRDTGKFVFHQGPIFSQVILADEINRATPKTQSALLEAMEERQITAEGLTRPLPQPFFVIATQNPSEQIGTFALPESQLDRFLVRLKLGYPDPIAERALLDGEDRRALLSKLQPVMTGSQLLALQQTVNEIRAAPSLIDYVQSLLEASRRSSLFKSGLSPRAGLGLLRVTRAWALIAGRNYALPEDVQQVFASVAGHRLQAYDMESTSIDDAVNTLLTDTPVPV